MAELTGTVIIAQEGRLHLVDDQGAGHLFIVSPKAATETAQLPRLQRGQFRVRVSYTTSPNLIALRADRIEVETPTGSA